MDQVTTMTADSLEPVAWAEMEDGKVKAAWTKQYQPFFEPLYSAAQLEALRAENERLKAALDKAIKTRLKRNELYRVCINHGYDTPEKLLAALENDKAVKYCEDNKLRVSLYQHFDSYSWGVTIGKMECAGNCVLDCECLPDEKKAATLPAAVAQLKGKP